MHPLIPSLENLKDSEIEKSIQELTNKYWAAQSQEIRYQISMVLETYNSEIMERRHRLWKKQHDEFDGKLDKLINVDK